ncbi:MAG: 30S ribosomal protein S2 [Patescibacteria group bacterium]
MTAGTQDIKTLFEAGAHFGYSRTRRHPTASPFIFGTKDRNDIFDLEETQRRLEAACAFASSIIGSGPAAAAPASERKSQSAGATAAGRVKQLLFVGGKNEAVDIIREAAARIGAPYVAGRWIGGSLTNFKNIRKRIDRLEKLMSERDSGELEKYTKKERLLIDREITELLARFGGLVKMLELPAALFIVDTRREETAVREANQLGIPVIGLSSSDCDFSQVQYPVPANDTSVRSIRLVAEAIAEAYEKGKTVAS